MKRKRKKHHTVPKQIYFGSISSCLLFSIFFSSVIFFFRSCANTFGMHVYISNSSSNLVPFVFCRNTKYGQMDGSMISNPITLNVEFSGLVVCRVASQLIPIVFSTATSSSWLLKSTYFIRQIVFARLRPRVSFFVAFFLRRISHSYACVTNDRI